MPSSAKRPEYPEACRWCERFAPREPVLVSAVSADSTDAAVMPGAMSHGRPTMKVTMPISHAPSDERRATTKRIAEMMIAPRISPRAMIEATPVYMGAASARVMRAPASAARYQPTGTSSRKRRKDSQ